MAVDDLVPNQLAQINAQNMAAANAAQQSLLRQPTMSQGPAPGFNESRVGRTIAQMIQDQQGQQPQAPAQQPVGTAAQKQQGGGAQQQTPTQLFQPPSQEYLRTIQLAQNYHAAKQAMAQQRLVEMHNQERAGIMPDPKQMIKLIKQSGLKVDLSKEGVDAASRMLQQSYQGPDPLSGQQEQMPKETQELMDKANAGSLTHKDLAQYVMGAMVKSDLRGARYQGVDDRSKAEFEHQGMEAIRKILDPSTPETQRGHLTADLAIHFPDSYGKMSQYMLSYVAGTDEGRAHQVGLAQGLMTDAEKVTARKTYDDMAQTIGIPNNLRPAFTEAMLSGKTLPQEILSKIPTFSPDQLKTQIEMLPILSNLGIQNQNLTNASIALQHGGPGALQQFLPPKSPVELQQGLAQATYDLHEREVEDTEKVQRAQIEDIEAQKKEREAQAQVRQYMIEHYGITGDSEMIKATTDALDKLVKSKAPKELVDRVEQALAMQFGIRKEVTPGWLWNTTQWKSAIDKGGPDTSQIPGQAGAAQTGAPKAPAAPLPAPQMIPMNDPSGLGWMLPAAGAVGQGILNVGQALTNIQPQGQAPAPAPAQAPQAPGPPLTMGSPTVGAPALTPTPAQSAAVVSGALQDIGRNVLGTGQGVVSRGVTGAFPRSRELTEAVGEAGQVPGPKGPEKPAPSKKEDLKVTVRQPTPESHQFSVSQYRKNHPGKNVDAAIIQAKHLGYEVVQ